MRGVRWRAGRQRSLLMRVVYACEKCGHEQQPALLTDWQCWLCGRVERTANELPKGWESFQSRRGELVAFCTSCVSKRTIPPAPSP